MTAFVSELRSLGLSVETEAPMEVLYKGTSVGVYYADVLVQKSVICEVKAVSRLLREHEAQLMHYLKATGVKVGLLLNFGAPSLQLKRMVV